MTLGKLAVLLTAVALAATGQLLLKHGMVEAQHTSHETGRSLLVVVASTSWSTSQITCVPFGARTHCSAPGAW